MRREPYFESEDSRRLAPDEDDLRVLDTPRSFTRSALVVRLALAACIISGLAMVAREKTRSEVTPRAGTEAQARPDPVLVKQARAPNPLLMLEATDPPAVSEPPRWNAATGLREDGLVQGAFDAIEAPFLRLTLSETALEPQQGPNPSLFVTLAHRAAEMRGLSVLRTGMRGVLDTKFGRFETVEATLSGQGTRQCIGFASLDARAMRIDGWLCGVLAQAPEPQAVACAIDGLRLAAAAVPTIEVAFGEAALRRGPGCGQGAGAGADETGSINRGGAREGSPVGQRSFRLTKK